MAGKTRKATVTSPYIGAQVLYYMPRSGEPRPAFIVRVWEGESYVNLQVLTDQRNDSLMDNVMWKTSVQYSDAREPDTWAWPE